ncbi:putative bifunctional diguanylate cyclase/phosphodiesterase [Pantoea sp. App145]|uniref:putative bifunctional diguanylate cyclase/phosphodiesterase n=1 Tax=Pantoea sp. App145 TaxID=3071567 RepID=UPI003A803B36
MTGNVTPSDVLKQADIALYKAKNRGRNQVCIFQPEFQIELNYRAQKTADLRDALIQQQFELYYQPIVDCSQRIIGYEALLRWHRPGFGTIPPDEFIPELERSGLITETGRWVLQEACARLAYLEKHSRQPEITMSVNVSERRLQSHDFVEMVRRVIKESSASPRLLRLELTESMLQNNVAESVVKMEKLQSDGVSFSLDDFSTGYSSLNILHRLPVNFLKIGRTFVSAMINNESSLKIIELITGLASVLSIKVVAEGVETEEQFRLLNAMHCDYFQGFLFGRPSPAPHNKA